jgi:hypothetical protein
MLRPIRLVDQNMMTVNGDPMAVVLARVLVV